VSRRQWIGPACAVLGVGGFSFKAILAKLVYQDPSVDVATLLALRMLYAAPFFTAMAWYGSRRANAHRVQEIPCGLERRSLDSDSIVIR